MGKSELAEDPRFKDIKDRIENHVEVKAIVQEWVGQNTVDEVVNGLLEKGVPVAPILNIAQVTSDPHIAEAREMFVRLDHPVAGKMRIAGSHLKLSKEDNKTYLGYQPMKILFQCSQVYIQIRIF